MGASSLPAREAAQAGQFNKFILGIIRKLDLADNSFMAISWYPGHMHKTGKELRKLMTATDAVIEVLDARIPSASANPLLAEIAAGKPALKLLNKSDLADPGATADWHDHLNTLPHCRCLVLNLDKRDVLESVLRMLDQLTAGVQTAVGARKQCVIFGIPNVGKSTVMNALAGRKLARTGNEPAVTKGQQRIRLNADWTLIDTPGMLWPKLSDQDAALRLAMTGSIRQTAIDIEEIGWLAAEYLQSVLPEVLKQRYELEKLPDDTEALLSAIARQTGGINKRGATDWAKVAQTLLNDYRSGKLGNHTLELPPAGAG